MKHTPEGKQLTDIILEIFKLSGFLVAEGDVLTKEQGLNSARWKVLGAISNTINPLTVSKVARNMGLTRQAVQRIANEMVTDGLLYFKDNPQHKRAKILVITKTGEGIFEELDKKQILWVNSIADPLKLKDLELTFDVLRELSARLQPKRGCRKSLLGISDPVNNSV